MRNATSEEVKLVNDYINSISQTVLTISIPNNPTNGDVIKAVFPNAEIIMPNDPTDDVTVDIHGVSSFLYFDFKWWNALYKGSEDVKR